MRYEVEEKILNEILVRECSSAEDLFGAPQSHKTNECGNYKTNDAQILIIKETVFKLKSFQETM